MFTRTCLMICTLWVSLSFWFQEQFLGTGRQYRLYLGSEIFRVSMCNHPHQQKVSQRFQAEVEYQDESEEPQQWKCARISERQQHHIKQWVSMYSSTENNKGQMIRYAVILQWFGHCDQSASEDSSDDSRPRSSYDSITKSESQKVIQSWGQLGT